jgi:two-component system phosphate regulon response regulator OmpR
MVTLPAMPTATPLLGLEPAPHILVVDDDQRLRDLLQRFLTEQGFVVAGADSAESAHAVMQSLTFDLLVVDVMMPGQNGLDFTSTLRQSSHVPIIILTARGEPTDRISGLEVGADDYLPKPFEPRELVLRINAILRRAPRPAGGHGKVIAFGQRQYSVTRSELLQGDAPIRLTETEAALMALLVSKLGQVVTRDDLVAAGLVQGSERAVDVLVTRLRRKLEDDPRQPRYLHTVRGEGYRLVGEG